MINYTIPQVKPEKKEVKESVPKSTVKKAPTKKSTTKKGE